MSDPTGGPPDSAHRVRRAIMVVDMVESVRLMQACEDDVIDRWRRFVAEVRAQLAARGKGRIVKSLGDGLLLEFDDAPSAARAAIRIQKTIGRYNTGRAAAEAMLLRIGGHLCEVLVDELDVFGVGVNLAARLATLAHPGGVVVSADFRDAMVPGLDPEFEDLGECQVKNLPGSVRAHRLLGTADAVALPGFDTLWDQRPAIAVLPLDAAGDADGAMVADVLVDQVIHDLSHCAIWRVISRLSTASLRGRGLDLAALGQHLKVTFVVSGRCRVVHEQVRVNIELAEVPTSSVVWAGVLTGTKADVMAAEGSLGTRIVEMMSNAIFDLELRRSKTRPLPTLSSHTLLLSAVALMHRLSRQDFARALAMLEELCARHPRAPDPYAWAAKWHCLAVVQGWGGDERREVERAREQARRALDERSDHALALAVDGLIAGFLLRDLDLSEQRYESAIAANPNEGLAWLFLSALHAYRDRGEQAAAAAANARHLSPLDPIRYYYDSFSAHAMLAADRLAEAESLAQRSLRANCTHLPTVRTLAIAQALQGKLDAARTSVERIKALDPGYTVCAFEGRYPGQGSALARRSAEALRAAGLAAA